MSSLFQNKYRIASARWRTWNYANEGMYFVTICTAGRECFFGSVTKGKMHLSPLGKIAESEWIKTPALRPDMNLQLGEFVVMPNHVHGIIMIGENKYNNTTRRDAMHRVSTGIRNILGKSNFGPQSKNLASILRGYKSAVTTYARKMDIGKDATHGVFNWQSRFHDHIIRNARSYQNISNYILNNPAKWKEDTFHI